MSAPLLESFKEIIACDDRERLEGMLVVAALTAPHLVPAIERQLHRLQADTDHHRGCWIRCGSNTRLPHANDHHRRRHPAGSHPGTRPEPLGPAAELDGRDAKRSLDSHSTADAGRQHSVHFQQ
jgi:hypothetical protein